jgi:DNA polymerase
LILHIDMETRSALDLKKVGVDVYSNHPSTDAWCMSYAFDDEPVQIIDIQDEFLPKRIAEHIENGLEVAGHNVAFELAIWNNIMVKRRGWPVLRPEQTTCTMVMAYAMALPGKLEKAAPAAGISELKDMAGGRVMLQLAQPRKVLDDGAIIWWTPEENPEKFRKLFSYCIQDTEVERELHKRLLALSPFEKKVWLLDQKINQRGVAIDMPAVKRAIEIVEYESARLQEEMRTLTKGAVATCNATTQLRAFLKDHGVETKSVAKADVLELLDTETLPRVCRQALLLRKEAAKSSTKKLEAMAFGAGKGNRICGLFQYSGANTRRWAGRRVQLQNLARGHLELDEVAEVFNYLHSNKNIKEIRDKIDILYGSPLDVVSSCIRGFLCAEKGYDLIAADFSAIEARVLAWLAGEEKVLDIFRGDGKIYEFAASKIYHVPMNEVTKAQRQIGKVSILALGYQGGVGAFQSMAKNYNVKVSDEEADTIKLNWREGNPNIVKYWYDLDKTAFRAVNSPNTAFRVGPPGREITFKTSGSFLWCQLPSKGILCYPYPKIERHQTPWGVEKNVVTYMTEDSTTKKWERAKAYGGHWAENVTQSLARDILVEAMFRLEEKGYPIIIHVHDEIVCEVPEGFGSVDEMEKIMSADLEWGKGLPIEASGWRRKRFCKD